MYEKNNIKIALMNCFEILGLEYDPPDKYENREIAEIISRWRAKTCTQVSFDEYKRVAGIMNDETSRYMEATAIRQKKIDELKKVILSKADDMGYVHNLESNYGLTAHTILKVCTSLGIKIDYGEVPLFDVVEPKVSPDSGLFDIYDEAFEKDRRNSDLKDAFSIEEPLEISRTIGIGIINSKGEYVWCSMIPMFSYFPIGSERSFIFHGEPTKSLTLSILESDDWNDRCDKVLQFPLNGDTYRVTYIIDTERLLVPGEKVVVQLLQYTNKMIVKISTEAFDEEYSLELEEHDTVSYVNNIEIIM